MMNVAKVNRSIHPELTRSIMVAQLVGILALTHTTFAL
jgi:hypothetical protein